MVVTSPFVLFPGLSHVHVHSKGELLAKSKEDSGLSFEGGFSKNSQKAKQAAVGKSGANIKLARHERAGWLVGSIKMLCSIQVVQ